MPDMRKPRPRARLHLLPETPDEHMLEQKMSSPPKIVWNTQAQIYLRLASPDDSELLQVTVSPAGSGWVVVAMWTPSSSKDIDGVLKNIAEAKTPYAENLGNLPNITDAIAKAEAFAAAWYAKPRA